MKSPASLRSDRVATFPGLGGRFHRNTQQSGRQAEPVNSILGSGTLISGGRVKHSILSSNVRVEDLAVVEDSILFEGVTMGLGAHIRNCIVDKSVQTPPESIGLDIAGDAQQLTVSGQGIIVVPKDYRFALFLGLS